jgi:hypothetical protein
MVSPHYATEHATLYLGDCLDVLRELPDGTVHAVVTDPPYALDFMGKEWDRFTPGDFQHWCEQWATECLRILKPGGHLLAFGGTRTFHRLAAGIEDAGFEIRDSIAWLYGSGFPKSLDVAKAIDKGEGIWRGRAGDAVTDNQAMSGPNYARTPKGDPVTAAAAWQGWGTALKPAFEPIVVARKPPAGTVASNVLAHGTGALNIDANRIPMTPEDAAVINSMGGFGKAGSIVNPDAPAGFRKGTPHSGAHAHDAGRWPANVILDEGQAAALDRMAPDTGGSGKASGPSLRDPQGASVAYGARNGLDGEPAFYGDRGGASRFFYSPKASGSERPKVDGVAHPTVKPVDLMKWLVRLVTPPGGTVLEPFAGSGTTVEAALTEGFHCIAIEREASYMPLIEARMRRPMQGSLFDF